MPKIFVVAAALVGIALVGVPATAFAQPGYGSSQRDVAPPDQQAGYDRGGSGPNGYAQRGDSQGGYGQNGYDRGRGQNGYDQNGYGQDGYDRSGRGQNGYDRNGYGQNGYYQGAYNQQGYDAYGPPPCAEDDDLESLRCHHRTHSRGWYHRSEREAYLRGDHYRGYQDDGTGRRSYDRGGFGVGHFDYTRDYNPLRGY